MEKFYLRCLLCTCTPDVTSHLHIFSEAGNQLQLADKIDKYLNIPIDAELPQNVCHSCMEKLEVTHQLVTSCQQARIMLLQIKQQSESFAQEVKQENSDCSMIEWDSCYQPATHSADIENCMNIKANEMEHSDSEDVEQSDNELAAQLDEEPTYNTDCTSPPGISVDVLPAIKDEMDSEQECSPQLVLQGDHEEVGEVTLEDFHDYEELTPVQQDDVGTGERKKAAGRRRPVRRKTRSARRGRVAYVSCDICNEKVKHKYSLIKHKNEKHNMNLTFDCEQCGRQFLYLNNISTHIRRMHKYNEHFFCEVCGKSFAKSVYASHLCRHMPKRELRNKPLEPVFCAVCNRREKHKFALLKHINSEHLDVLVAAVNYCCELCTREFPRYKTFVQHLRNVHLPKVKCGHCGKMVKQCSMGKHMRQHEPKANSTFKAVESSEETTQTYGAKFISDMIEEHIINLEPGEPQNADVEPSMQSKLTGCQAHVPNLLECASCSFHTDKKTDLIQHMQAHQASYTSDGLAGSCAASDDRTIKNLKCVKCRIRYGDPDMFAWHTENCHGADAIVNILGQRKHTYQCIFCQSVFKNIEMTIKHLHNQHRVNNFPFCCKFCNKSFSYTQAVKRHQRICKKRNTSSSVNLDHQWKRIDGVKCNLCNRAFESQNQLENHISTFHAVISLPYKCRGCDESFRYISHLKSHCLDRHPGIHTWQCDVCNAKFNKYTVYVRHKKHQHSTGVFPCNLCPAKYYHPESLKEHKKIKHSLLENSMACKLCDATFSCKKYLRQHIYRVHLHPILHCGHCKYITHNKVCLVKHLTHMHSNIFNAS